MKPCIICKVEKPLDGYYKHKKMADGHLNKCKECYKGQSKTREQLLRKDPEYVEKEKERARDKYKRLYVGIKPSKEVRERALRNYSEKFPEKIACRYSTIHIKTKPGHENHHWSYHEEHHLDFITLKIEDHKTIHRYLIYDQERWMYRTTEGVLLDTREAHEEYIYKFI